MCKMFEPKNFFTNLISLLLVVIGYFMPPSIYQQYVISAGVFALAGAITNWLAIYMLFEKIPFLYGSGVIPTQFESFKRGISSLIMNQFFTVDTLKRFLGEEKVSGEKLWELAKDKIDMDKIFDALVSGVKDSSLGAMLGLVGGEQALYSMKPNIVPKLQVTIKGIVEDLNVSGDTSYSHLEELREKVSQVVSSRLEELTPEMVKQIIQDMIRKHLGWLVVWGGVFGGLLGIIAEGLKIV